MRSFLIDELDESLIAQLGAILDERELASGIKNLYWLPLDEDMLTPLQKEHAAECGPHCMALELLPNGVRLELLVRARGKVQCECVGYTSAEAEQVMIQRLSSLVDEIHRTQVEGLFEMLA